MALFAVLAGDRALGHRLTEVMEPRHSVAFGHSWGGLNRVVRERPVIGALIDLDAVPSFPSAEGALAGLRAQFPHLGLVLLLRRHRDPFTLFRVGKAGIANLSILFLDEIRLGMARALARAGDDGATSRVLRALSPHLTGRELRVAFLAMDFVHRRWTAEDLAGEAGLSRPHLSECLKKSGLPSVGHLLLWARLFHAGHWLEDPGRTGESIGRQLEYSSGAAFRRALKLYTGATPMEVRERGGLSLVLHHFFRRTGLPAPGSRFRVGVAGGKGRSVLERSWM